jgi:hypothetical protein
MKPGRNRRAAAAAVDRAAAEDLAGVVDVVKAGLVSGVNRAGSFRI